MAQLESAIADSVQVAKDALKAQGTESKDVVADKGPSYSFYFPYFDVDEKFPKTELFDHIDPGSRADHKKPHLLTPNHKVSNTSPYLGTEVHGVQLSEFTKECLDELALYVAERKVVIFRDQNLKDLGPERQIEIAKHFGPHSAAPTSGNVKGFPEFHVVYRDAKDDRFREYAGANRANHTQWHSDVSYELQPPGTTFFFILDQPCSCPKLEPTIKRLEGLRALHSAVPQAEFSRKRNGPVRREPVETEHPVVRVYPVTGEKAPDVNLGFTKSIVGFKQEESDYLLKFLFDHISKGSDFQIRARYEPGTVVVWVCPSVLP